MSEDQPDLLGEHSFSDTSLLAHLDEVPEIVRNKWPKDLNALCEIYTGELQRLGVDAEAAHKISLALLLAQANYGGGRMFYLPKGDRLRQAVRDHRIYNEFNGTNVDQLASRHHLTVQRIYEIIKRQREIERARIQPGLF